MRTALAIALSVLAVFGGVSQVDAGRNDVHVWKTGKWNPCSTSVNGGPQCGGGVSYRDVFCQNGGGDLTTTDKCKGSGPKSSRECDRKSCTPQPLSCPAEQQGHQVCVQPDRSARGYTFCSGGSNFEFACPKDTVCQNVPGGVNLIECLDLNNLYGDEPMYG